MVLGAAGAPQDYRSAGGGKSTNDGTTDEPLFELAAFFALLGVLRRVALDLFPLARLPGPVGSHRFPGPRDPGPARLALGPSALDPLVVDTGPFPVAGDPDVSGARLERRRFDPERGRGHPRLGVGSRGRNG